MVFSSIVDANRIISLIISEVWNNDRTDYGCSVVVCIFSFVLEGTGKGEMSIMHEYTVCVLGVPDFTSHLMLGHWR